jgi:uncharacterized Rmd1/YagE family protein
MSDDDATEKIIGSFFHYLHSFFDNFAQFINTALLANNSIDINKASFAIIRQKLNAYPEYSLILQELENFSQTTEFQYIEDFKLEVREESEFELNYNSIIVPSLNNYYLDMLATVLSKSVALKKIEEDIDILLDEIEDIIEFLDKGHLNLSDEKLSKMSGNILKFKYNTISYIMLLEKPKIAWNNEEAEAFFVDLSELFELKDRYEKIRHKTEMLLDITDVFTSLTHSKRGTRLEWAVIILIMIELIMSIIDKIF